MPESDRPAADPLRRLLDAVLAEPHDRLADMAAGAFTSRFHFVRTVSAVAGESPVALRRRVTLERAAWRLQRGGSVTDTAFESGYESVEGFTRAFTRAYGHPPTAMAAVERAGHWLPAPNGIHFHSPTVLYVDAAEGGPAPSGRSEVSAGNVTALQVRHDLDDITALLDATARLPHAEYERIRLPGSRPRHWDGPDESLAQVMWHLVHSKPPWLAAIAGEPAPELDPDPAPASLRARHREIGPRWLALIRDIDRRGAWADRIVDALCDPPESFLLSQIVAHELTFSAHRRLLARWMLADAGHDTTTDALDPDPIIWHRRLTGGPL